MADRELIAAILTAVNWPASHGLWAFVLGCGLLGIHDWGAARKLVLA